MKRSSSLFLPLLCCLLRETEIERTNNAWQRYNHKNYPTETAGSFSKFFENVDTFENEYITFWSNMYKAVKEKVQVEEKYIYLSFNFYPFYLGNLGPNPVRLTSVRVAHWSSA